MPAGIIFIDAAIVITLINMPSITAHFLIRHIPKPAAILVIPQTAPTIQIATVSISETSSPVPSIPKNYHY